MTGEQNRKSWPGYPLSGYPLATPEGPKHCPLPPEAKSSSDDGLGLHT